jgi:outer membrane lipoprotein SlyB
MKKTLKSKLFAAALTFAAAFTMTAGQAIVVPDTAQAGVIGSIKGAAKKVGGAVKNSAVGIGKAAKAGAAFGKQAGGVIAKYVPPVKGVVNAGKAVKVLVSGKR